MTYGISTLAPVGLFTTEHASLRWTHYGPNTQTCSVWHRRHVRHVGATWLLYLIEVIDLIR